jgi:hypothetical protein
MRLIFLSATGLAITLLSFFGSLYLLESVGTRSMDSLRMEHAKSLKAALEQHRTARGKYPVLVSGSDVADLKRDLVDGGFMSSLPVDPYWTNGRINRYRYRSDGTSYSLLIHFELGPCQTGIGPATLEKWDGHNVLKCPF